MVEVTTMGKALVERFLEKPTFVVARRIWLEARRLNVPCPKEIEDFFISRLEEDDKIWFENRMEQGQKRLDERSFNDDIACMHYVDGMTYDEIAVELGKKSDDVHHSGTSLEDRVKRLNKKGVAS